MAETYNDILKVQIGRVKASMKADNYFPVAGKDSVRMDATTRWGQSSEWQTKDGGGTTTTKAGNLAGQKDSKTIAISGNGELVQKFIARNLLTEAEVVKRIYAMERQTMPYFEVTATEVIRVGDTGVILIKPENGYPDSRERTITARIYKENTNSNPVKTLNFDAGRPTPEGYVDNFSFTEASDRGIYDVEVDVTDTLTGVTLTKRIDKLLTVTPKLCPKPADTSQGYEVILVQAEKQYEIHLWRDVDSSGLNYAEWTAPHGSADSAGYNLIDLSMLPAGTTLCIKRDEGEIYPMRMRLRGSASTNGTSDNGTPNFTYEKPLVIMK